MRRRTTVRSETGPSPPAATHALIAHPMPGRSGKQVLYIWAGSEDHIKELLPDAEIWEPAPEWMTEEMKERVGMREYDIDKPFDIHTPTHSPDVVFNRNDPSPGFDVLRDDPNALQRGPHALAKARKLFRERP
jgi:hypothetical protein